MRLPQGLGRVTALPQTIYVDEAGRGDLPVTFDPQPVTYIGSPIDTHRPVSVASDKDALHYNFWLATVCQLSDKTVMDFVYYVFYDLVLYLERIANVKGGQE